MSNADAPTTIGQEAYVSWRATSFGDVTEAIEQRLILDVMGELAERRVLDAGCASARGAADRRDRKPRLFWKE